MNNKQNSLRILITATAILACIPLRADDTPSIKASATPQGVLIESPAAGAFTLAVPNLTMSASDYKGEKPAVTVEDATTLLAKYPSGAELRLDIADGTITGTYAQLPAGAFGFRFVSVLPVKPGQPGSFALGEKAATPFPVEKGSQSIGNGWVKIFQVQNAAGAGFALATPGAFQEVQDNRFFNWNVFVHILTYRFDEYPGAGKFIFRATPLPAAGQ